MTYNIGKSMENRFGEGAPAPAPAPAMEAVEDTPIVAAPAAANENGMADGVYLFTTQTCPNCKLAVAMLEKAGVHFEKMLASDHKELCEELKIKQAPTLVSVYGNKIEKVAGLSAVKGWLESRK